MSAPTQRSPLGQSKSMPAPASPSAPLLPVATPPARPGLAPPPGGAHRHPTRRAFRRLLLLAAMVVVVIYARWGARALLRIGQGGSLDSEEGGWEALRAGGGPERPPANASAAGAHAASAADNAVTAALDAGAALKDAGGAVKHTAVAAGQAVGAAATLAAPLAAKAAEAAGSVGSAAKSAVAGLTSAATDAAADAAASDTAHTGVAATDNQTSASASASAASAAGVAGPPPPPQQAQVPQEGPQEPRPPAELPPPVVDDASSDACAQALALPKVALLFLTKGPMPHEAAWRLWLQSAAGALPARQAEAALCNAAPDAHATLVEACATERRPDDGGTANEAAQEQEQGQGQEGRVEQQRLFSVYVHAPPSYEGYPEGGLWAGHLIGRRVEAGWGDMRLVEATRNLLWEAYRDPLNQRFILLSESDVPLYDPLTLHAQLLSESKSRVKACAHPATHVHRWSKEMRTEHMNASHWRKSGQWIGLTREHAEAALRDEEVYRSFEAHCWSDWSPRRGGWRDCFPDEHYFATLLAVLGREGETACEGWGVSAQDWSAGGAHPKSFRPHEVGPALIARMRHPQHCDSAAAYAGAQRSYVDAADALAPDQGRACSALQAAAAAAATFARPLPDSCPLTARKFPPETADAVLRLERASCSDSPAGDAAAGGAGEGSAAEQAPVRLLSQRYCQRLAEGAAERRGEAEQPEA